MRRSGWVAVVAAVGLGLTGCSDPGTPSDTLPTAGSTTAEPTLEPLGPADLPVPAEAREKTEAGAAAFVRYYIDLINRAQGDLDVQYLSDFAPDCQTCDTLAQGLAYLAEQRFSVEGGGISISTLNDPSIAGDEAQFVASIAQEDFTVRDSAGAIQESLSVPAASYPASGGLLAWSTQDSCWRVTQLTIG